MKKKIQFSLVYRDMWQSSGKFQPRKDQLERIAPVIIEMGCFARVETNGGAFEQVCLLAGENPNDAVRAFCKPFNEVGIKTHMLDRGLNALRMYPVPDDVRALMYKVKHAQGVDIPRIFDGLNDTRNIIPSIKWAKEAGMTPQATLCITTSPVHTLDYYMAIADEVVAAGAEEICLKDMAGIGQPAFLGQLTKMIKTKYPDIIIQYHGHSGPGLSMASILEVCENGADIIDTAIEPLSWGKVHPDIISVQSMLKNEGFDVPEINMNAYMKARSLTQEFIDDWLGYFINPGNKHMSSLLLGCGLPGGMMGSMMADLGGIMGTINNLRRKKGDAELSTDDMLVISEKAAKCQVRWLLKSSNWPKNKAENSSPTTREPSIRMRSTISARKWTKTAGNTVRTTRNSGNWRCIPSNIATTRAVRRRKTCSPTSRRRKTLHSAENCRLRKWLPSNTRRPTRSWLP